MHKILLLASCLAVLASPIDGMRKKLPVITGDEDEFWMPDVRNTVRIGPPGTTAAEFVVGSGVEEEIASKCMQCCVLMMVNLIIMMMIDMIRFWRRRW